MPITLIDFTPPPHDLSYFTTSNFPLKVQDCLVVPQRMNTTHNNDYVTKDSNPKKTEKYCNTYFSLF